MPDYDDDFDFDDDDQQPTPKNLRDALKKANAALAKERADKQAALERAEKAEKAAARSQNLTDLLKEKGVSPRFAKWAEKDSVDATAEAVEAWLKENPEFLPAKPAAKDGEPAPKQKVTLDGVEPDEEDEDDEPPLSSASLDPNLLALLEADGNLGAQGTAPANRTPIQRLADIDNSKYDDFDSLVGALNKELGKRA